MYSALFSSVTASALPPGLNSSVCRRARARGSEQRAMTAARAGGDSGARTTTAPNSMRVTVKSKSSASAPWLSRIHSKLRCRSCRAAREAAARAVRAAARALCQCTAGPTAPRAAQAGACTAAAPGEPSACGCPAAPCPAPGQLRRAGQAVVSSTAAQQHGGTTAWRHYSMAALHQHGSTTPAWQHCTSMAAQQHGDAPKRKYSMCSSLASPDEELI